MDSNPSWLLTLYTASNLRHAHRWLALRAQGYPVRSSWIDQGHMASAQEYAALWRTNVDEVACADVFLLYQEAGDSNKGALVELGVALATDSLILYVGPNAPCGEDGPFPLSVLCHPSIVVCSTLDDALEQFHRWDREEG